MLPNPIVLNNYIQMCAVILVEFFSKGADNFNTSLGDVALHDEVGGTKGASMEECQLSDRVDPSGRSYGDLYVFFWKKILQCQLVQRRAAHRTAWYHMYILWYNCITVHGRNPLWLGRLADSKGGT